MLLGEGDFSFSKALARIFGLRHAQKLVATTYDWDGKRDLRDRLLESKREVESMGGGVIGESTDCTQLHVREYNRLKWGISDYEWDDASATYRPLYGFIQREVETVNGPYNLMISDVCRNNFFE